LWAAHCQNITEADEAVQCSTQGGYASRVYDSLDGEYLAFNICDRCFEAAGEAGRLMVTRDSRPLWAQVPIAKGKRLLSIVGWEYVESRPYLPWRRGYLGDGDRRIFDPRIEEITKDMHLYVSVESLLVD
jgi:hypothetical protein